MVKRGLTSPRGYGARMRDRIYDETLYAYRSVGEGIFGALTVEFGDRIKTKKRESTKNKNNPKNHNVLPKNHSKAGL
jgi:hypothetical protein